MALVSHLDLVRLFDRVVRRASLPIAFTGGYHPGPRISIANALSLGNTSSGEIVDFELTQKLDKAEFQQRLTASLPTDIPIYQVEEVDVKSLAATRVLEKAEYLITIANHPEISETQWLEWVEKINESQEIFWEKTTKSKKKVQVNLCDRLDNLTLEQPITDQKVTLRYIGSCRNDGTVLTPEQLIYMIEQTAQTEIQILTVHRVQLILNPTTPL